MLILAHTHKNQKFRISGTSLHFHCCFHLFSFYFPSLLMPTHSRLHLSQVLFPSFFHLYKSGGGPAGLGVLVRDTSPVTVQSPHLPHPWRRTSRLCVDRTFTISPLRDTLRQLCFFVLFEFVCHSDTSIPHYRCAQFWLGSHSPDLLSRCGCLSDAHGTKVNFTWC